MPLLLYIGISENVVSVIYIISVIISILFFSYNLIVIRNKQLSSVKMNSESFYVIKSNSFHLNNEKTISTDEVRIILKKGIKDDELLLLMFIIIILTLIGIIIPSLVYPYILVTSLENMPYNYIRLLIHLRKIEKS